MAPCDFPRQHLIAALALWLDRQQQAAIDYLKEVDRLLKEKLGNCTLRFTDAVRQRLATRAKALGRQLHPQLDTLVIPDTLLCWHRELVTRKWAYPHKRKLGRPRVRSGVVELVLQPGR